MTCVTYAAVRQTLLSVVVLRKNFVFGYCIRPSTEQTGKSVLRSPATHHIQAYGSNKDRALDDVLHKIADI